MFVFLAILCCLPLIYLGFLLYDLRSYVKQLELITETETNRELQLQTRSPYLKQITLLNNEVLRQQKETRSELVGKTRHLEQALHNISHDLRTPLTVANGYTQFLLKSEVSSSQQELLEKIGNNLESVENHLEQLLDYQRLNENQVVPVFEKVALSRLLEEQIVALYQSFMEAGIDLVIDVEQELDVITDKKLITRVIQNVLGNILKHGTTAAEISLHQKEDQVVLIAKNQLSAPINHPERLTERFYTEDLSRQSKNSGIGLFIIDELVKRVDGEMILTATEADFSLEIRVQKNKLSL